MQGQEKKPKCIRCRRDILRRMDALCAQNHIDRSTFITIALRNYIILLESSQLLEADPQREAPIPYTYEEEWDQGLSAAESWDEEENE